MELEKKSSGHGGVREGSGRKPGSTQKLSAKEILAAIEATANGTPYEVILANDFLQARYGDDKHLVAKYHQLILSKVIADKVDITSNGQSIAPTLTFAKSELPDYTEQVIDVKPT
jgi:hypothetical protein